MSEATRRTRTCDRKHPAFHNRWPNHWHRPVLCLSFGTGLDEDIITIYAYGRSINKERQNEKLITGLPRQTSWMTKGWLDRIQPPLPNLERSNPNSFFRNFFLWPATPGNLTMGDRRIRGVPNGGNPNPFPNKLTTISGEPHGGTPPTHPFLEPFKTGREPFCWRARSWCSWRPWPPLLLVFPCPKNTKWGTQNLLYFKGNIILIVQGQATFKSVKSQKFDKSWIINHKCSPQSLEGPRLS